MEQFQKKIDKANVDIKKLKIENSKLYNVIEKLSPLRKFENHFGQNIFGSWKAPARTKANHLDYMYTV